MYAHTTVRNYFVSVQSTPSVKRKEKGEEENIVRTRKNCMYILCCMVRSTYRDYGLLLQGEGERGGKDRKYDRRTDRADFSCRQQKSTRL